MFDMKDWSKLGPWGQVYGAAVMLLGMPKSQNRVSSLSFGSPTSYTASF